MELLLVNPRRRKRRKLSAKQRKYFGKRRRRRATRAAAPRRRRRRAVAAAPRRRRRRAVMRVSRRRRRSNPSLRSFTGSIVPTVKAGVIGALGALGLDVAIGYLAPKLPAQLQTGYGLTATKVLGAIAVGIAGGYALRGRGGDLAKGAMTVVLHDELKRVVAAQFPTIPLGEYFSVAPTVGYPGIAYNPATGMGEYFTGDAGFGEYMTDSDDAVGY
ncbi:MAG: hypothetical protein AB7P97_20370 [Hyphomonadaceae bacterium]